MHLQRSMFVVISVFKPDRNKQDKKERYLIHRDYYQSVFGYRQYHVLGIKIVLCEPLASIIHYFLFPIHDTADTQRHEGNNLFII